MPVEKRARMTVAMLERLVRYDPGTGKLFWRFRTPDMFRDGVTRPEARCAWWNYRHATREAFRPLPGGRPRQETIFGRAYTASHVVWALVHGHWPDGDIERADGDRANHHHDNLILRPYGSIMNGQQRSRAAEREQPPAPIHAPVPETGGSVTESQNVYDTPVATEPVNEPVNPANPYRGVHWGAKKGMWAAIDRTNLDGPDDNLPHRGIASGPARLIDPDGYATAEEAREAVWRAERVAGYDESLSIPPLRPVRGYGGVFAREADHPATSDDYPAGRFFFRVIPRSTVNASASAAVRVIWRGPFDSPGEAAVERDIVVQSITSAKPILFDLGP